MRNFLKIVQVDQFSIIPIYRQVANAIVEGVETGQISNNDMLPSLHDFHVALDISINSVRRAYGFLKKEGIVGSMPGKGFFVVPSARVVERNGLSLPGYRPSPA